MFDHCPFYRANGATLCYRGISCHRVFFRPSHTLTVSKRLHIMPHDSRGTQYHGIDEVKACTWVVTYICKCDIHVCNLFCCWDLTLSPGCYGLPCGYVGSEHLQPLDAFSGISVSNDDLVNARTGLLCWKTSGVLKVNLLKTLALCMKGSTATDRGVVETLIHWHARSAGPTVLSWTSSSDGS